MTWAINRPIGVWVSLKEYNINLDSVLTFFPSGDTAIVFVNAYTNTDFVIGFGSKEERDSELDELEDWLWKKCEGEG